MMNNKGFTLVELLATILVLALVMSIGTFSIVSIIKNSKEKNYNFLISNIKDGAEVYYQECKYSNNSGISCNYDAEKQSYNVSLGDLVKYEYVKGNSTDKNDKFALVNVLNDKKINECMIMVKYNNGKINVEAAPGSRAECPTSNEYLTGKMDD